MNNNVLLFDSPGNIFLLPQIALHQFDLAPKASGRPLVRWPSGHKAAHLMPSVQQSVKRLQAEVAKSTSQQNPHSTP
jgi:hypothetical protein